MTRILVADDHPLFREALSGALEPYFENAQIIQAGSLDDAMAKLNEFDGVQLILLDLNMPGGEYLTALSRCVSNIRIFLLVLFRAAILLRLSLK